MRRIVIFNRSVYRQGQLKKFVEKAATEVLNDKTAPILNATFLDTKRQKRVCGWGAGEGNRICIWMPRNGIDKKRLVLVIARQLGSLKGIPHRSMNGNGRYDPRLDAYKDLYAWADDLPLEKMEKKKPEQTGGKYLRKLDHARMMIAKAKQRIRLREQQLIKARRQLKRWELTEEKLEAHPGVAQEMIIEC